MNITKKIFTVLIFVSSILFLLILGQVNAQTPDSSQTTQDLQNKINDLQNKINDLQGKEKTLSSEIDVMDNQIRLTEYRIQSVQKQISDITLDIDTTTKKITSLQESLDNLIGVLLNRIVATYEVGTIQPFEVLMSSNSVSNFFTRLNYLKVAQSHDKKLVYETQQAKNDYANQKQIFENKKKQVELLKSQLERYTNDLNQQKSSKQELLAETQGSEANYQRILAETRAQLVAFSNFTKSQGGASILNNQTVCDDWGCYYNQRDSQWGNTALNNTQYTIASDGCLVTSMAMVYTHFGYKDITPLSINAISSNFGGIPPALLRYNISANNVSSKRIGSSIDSELASGRPVIVGISYGGPIPDHFVVLISGSNGNYKMNDPFTPSGHNIDFTSKYSVGSIVEIDRIEI